MAFSSWLCTNSTKNMLVKIVHPGGHVELHDRPVLAADIMIRNPRCCVAHPHVFQQPWAIVAPDTMLMLGQKFYVVPISTIRKLQRLSLKFSPSPVQESPSGQSCRDEGVDNRMVSTCWLFMNKNTPKQPYDCLKQPDDKGENLNTGSNTGNSIPKEMGKDGCSWGDNCFMCLHTGIKIKGNSEDSSDEMRSSSTIGASETKELTRKRTKDFTRKGIRGSPKRHTSFDHWQPRLESINEE